MTGKRQITVIVAPTMPAGYDVLDMLCEIRTILRQPQEWTEQGRYRCLRPRAKRYLTIFAASSRRPKRNSA